MSERAARLHETAWQGVFTLTGGGVSLLSELLGTAGASATVLEAKVPYSAAALAAVLGGEAEQAVSAATARALGMAAWQQAKRLSSHHSKPIFALACTASLATNRHQRGQNRAHWILQTDQQVHLCSAELDGSREQQEHQLTDWLWHTLNCLLIDSGWQSCPGVTHTATVVPPAWLALFDEAPYRTCSENHDGLLLLPGSFNPVHDGHRQMLAVAEQLSGRSGSYELCVRNADKPAIDAVSLQQRISTLDKPVWLTNLATYQEKARLFPGAIFAIGVDTIARVGQVRFYHNSSVLMAQAIDELAQRQVEFLVFGRSDGRQFVQLKDLDLPPQLRKLCTAVPESTYRNDISSTELRRSAP